MKLVQKLTAALFLGLSLILAANGYFRVRREVTAFRADRVHDHALIGRSLAAAFAAVWRLDGQAGASAMLEASGTRDGTLKTRWVPLDANISSILGATADGEALTSIGPDATGDERCFTYVPVALQGTRQGVVEVSESLAAERRFLRATIQDTTIATMSLAIVSGALSVMLGIWLVGRPVGALTAKARRIGQGDFSGTVDLRRNDELGELAVEMNAMCARLLGANERVASETAARISAIEQLRHADRLTTVGKLASGVAHELGTPLNVVLARASMIASGEATGDEARDYSRIVVDASERMARIIRDLLEFARRRGSDKAMTDLRPLTQSTLGLLRSLAGKRNITLDFSGASTVVVNVDAGQFQQAVTNLVVNAMQASPDGATVSTTIGVEDARPPADVGSTPDRYAVLRVTDSGHGIAPETLPHVFEPFFTTKDVGEGTGLGLSVSYGIVREHGGWIGVESELGHGATFTIYLPMR